MTWIIRGQVSEAPYYCGELRWSKHRSKAQRFAVRTEALRELVRVRLTGIPSKLFRVGKGLGVRMPTVEAKALRDVADKAEKVVWYRGPPNGDWALKSNLSNALVELRRVTTPPSSTGEKP